MALLLCVFAGVAIAIAFAVPKADPPRCIVRHGHASYGFSFSGGGLFMAFHIGAANVLRRSGMLTESTPLAGCSAGSIVAVAIRCGIPHEDIVRFFFDAVRDLRTHGTDTRLSDVLSHTLDRFLPQDAHLRCTGSVFIGVTKLVALRHELHNRFDSRDDLIDAIVASCFVPMYTSARWTHRFRGSLVLDGGFTCLVPSLPPPIHTVKICCLSAAHVKTLPFLGKAAAMAGVAIGPDRWDSEMSRAINHPGPDELYVRLMDQAERVTTTFLSRRV